MRPVLLASITMLALTAACSDDTKQELKPCPPKGIGVEAADGTSCTLATLNQPYCSDGLTKDCRNDPKGRVAFEDCLDQVKNFSRYQCLEPEICVDVGVRIVPSFMVDPMSAPESVVFVLTNCTASNKKLTISKVVVVGDKLCSFKEPELETKELDPGKQVLLRSVYKPLAPGVDYAGLLVTSDAQNFKPLKIPMCGRAMARYKPGLDSGVGDAGGGADKATNVALRCEDVSSQGVNTTCHKD